MLSGDPHQQAINARLALDFAANLHANKEDSDRSTKLPKRLERGTAVTKDVSQSRDQMHEKTVDDCDPRGSTGDGTIYRTCNGQLRVNMALNQKQPIRARE